MSKKLKRRQSLEEILASCSDTLFPADLGAAPVTVDSRDADGDTPLHVLARRGNNYGLERLIEAGADVNAIGDMSETPLHVALHQKNLVAVELLLNAGAVVSLVSEFDQSPLSIANDLGGEFRALMRQKAGAGSVGQGE
ncbi:ankyrin repeat domain-containing protein [uncultured Roseibium sp.]|uniref:ankyrin repeat domain-containing protein n=1 Tax=uncultured Roseibium sp. TaxID=1936171 RepID=UPI0026132B76|nr:ankyrin repeat domain-containing protein [uncultured Roseibium sp.]